MLAPSHSGRRLGIGLWHTPRVRALAVVYALLVPGFAFADVVDWSGPLPSGGLRLVGGAGLRLVKERVQITAAGDDWPSLRTEFEVDCWHSVVEPSSANTLRARAESAAPAKELTVYFFPSWIGRGAEGEHSPAPAGPR